MSKFDAKEQIVNSATKYFSKFGFHKTTMDEIARHIHKAKGVLYYYFKGKEELFNEVLKQELNAVKIELKKIVDADNDSLITLKEYTLTRLRLLHKAVNYHETLKADFFEKYLFVKDVREDFSAFERDQLTIILERGKNESFLDFTNINSTINIFMMVINGVEIPLYLQEKYAEYESTIDELSSMIVNSLRTQKK
jgi:AcrR family transcriptional regulator